MAGRWEHTFRAGDSFRERTHSAPPAGASEGQRECLRGDWCAGRRITTVDGKAVITPALTYRPYCDPCEAYIGECIEALPSAYSRLEGELGEKPSGGAGVRSPFGPRLPLREDIDALMRLIAVRLYVWEMRVRSLPALGLRQREPGVAAVTAESVATSVRTLTLQLGPLLALQPSWMSHLIPLRPGRHGAAAVISDKQTGELVEQLREFAEHEIVRIGVDSITVLTQAGGDVAGQEILRLHHKAQAILGETRQRPETLDGVPCRNPECEDMALERAEPPSDPSLPAMYSRCASCHAQMSREDFLAWAGMYAAWADDQAMVCRLCKAARCTECAYARCACGKHGRAAA